jgi:hypothetical protein
MTWGLGAATVLALSAVGTGVARADFVPAMCRTAGVDTSAVKKTFDVVSGEIAEPTGSPLYGGEGCYFYNKNMTITVALCPKSEGAAKAATVAQGYTTTEHGTKQALTGLGAGAFVFVASTKNEGWYQVAAFFTARSYFVVAYGEFLTSTGEHQFIGVMHVIHAKLG